jgi:hypothetical protein
MLRPATNGYPMALDTQTFLIVLAGAVVAMGLVVWVMYKKVQ